MVRNPPSPSQNKSIFISNKLLKGSVFDFLGFSNLPDFMRSMGWGELAVYVAIILVTYIVWNLRKTAPTTKEEEPAPIKKQSQLSDIEDLVGKSLIPSTLKQMKASGVKPLSMPDKVAKVVELEAITEIPNFAAHLKKHNVFLPRDDTVVFQLNIGYYCNQACSHCHVDSSPLRKHMMSKEIATKCLEIIQASPSIRIVDLTGGAPELNREFRFLVEEVRKLGLEVIDRCNLTVLLEPHQQDLAEFLARNKVRVVASLPCYLEDNVDGQRGDQIFMRSIKGLQMLNDVGYGRPGAGLSLDLVYNPTGLHLPPRKEKLQMDYKRELKKRYNIDFNELICITNMPINRFYDHLKATNDLERYMHLLVDNFNTGACGGLMCKTYISVDPDGQLFDCDFNQQLDLGIKSTLENKTVFDITSTSELKSISIVTKKHCFGCTAGAGSSCGAV